MKKMIIITIMAILSILDCAAPKSTEISYRKVRDWMKEMIYEEEKDRFLIKLAMIESANQLDVVNRIGAMGLWQMMPYTLRMLGVDTTGFLQDSIKQRRAVEQLIDVNKCHLSDVIAEYDSTYYNGILITENAILAAAHLAGAGNVKAYFEGGRNCKDRNGTSIEHYLEEFN